MTITDLLNGGTVWPNTEFQLDRLAKIWKGRRVSITGACGSIGYALVEFLVTAGAFVQGIDWDELAMSKHLGHNANIVDAQVDWRLGSFEGKVGAIDLHQTEFIFHCAAYKHVDLAVQFPDDFSWNNASRTRDLLKLLKNRPDCEKIKFLLVSSDKAAGRTVLGRSKQEAEDITIENGGIALRLVNVIRSRGSVVSNWDKAKAPWVCPEHVQRLWMSQADAVRALLEVAELPSAIYTVQNVPMYTMGELASAYEVFAQKMIRRTQSLRPGESDKEELISSNERMLTVTNELAKVLPTNANFS